MNSLRRTLWATLVATLNTVVAQAEALPPTHPANGSPWDRYNDGVRAYAAGDFARAFQRWQDLALESLPRRLQAPVWFQLGNAQFRLGEPLEARAPEEAAELWRRSCSAFRAVLGGAPRRVDAQHNLALVERRLARLTHRLGLELWQQAGLRPLDPAIDLLRTANERFVESQALAPLDRQIRTDRERGEVALREKLLERATQAETKGDEEVRRNNPWADAEAESQYRAALADLGEASRTPTALAAATPGAQTAPTPAEDPTLSEAQVRVNCKLAELLTRLGQREQQAAEAQVLSNPDEALERFETALGHFAQAQQVQPGHEPAQRGEREVRAALEQLHVREGTRQLDRGRRALAQQSPQAAPALIQALGSFTAAQSLNPHNLEARQGADEARRLLPAALVLAAQSEVRAGDRAEPHWATEALQHYQEAETAFRRALDLAPDEAQAQQGLRELEPRLARARERVAREADQAAQQSLPAGRQPPTLEAALGQVNERHRDPQGEWDRQRQAARNQPGSRRSYPDW
ncbi:MAG: hypothetical protein FJ387_04135 [Verrucomicrobia bacterium]|nr:hypothetical protein [Verrucomicrobiota bacterium]